MEKVIELSFKEVSNVIQSAFTGARSRKMVKVRVSTSHHVSNYYDGGSKTTSVFLKVGSLSYLSLSDVGFVMQEQGNPFHQIVGDVQMTDYIFCVEHVIFCGKDLGYRIYVSPTLFSKMNSFNVSNILTAVAEQPTM